MFQFSRFAPAEAGDGLSDRRVPPFGNHRITAWLRLPDAYRSNPRPSSPTDTKASIVSPYLLDHITLFFSSLLSFFRPFTTALSIP